MPGLSLCFVTEPSQTLLGSITWKEIRRAIDGCRLPFLPRINGGIEDCPAIVEMRPACLDLGYSALSVERASGQHAKDLLVIVEEASSDEDEISDAIEFLGYERLVAIGNPIRAGVRFVDLIRQTDTDLRDGTPPHLAVKAIQIPSTDSPHASLDKSPWGIANRTWLEFCYRRYGKDSLWVRSHIRSENPEVSSDILIPSQWLDYATSIQRPPLPPTHPVHKTRRIAIDLGEGVGRDSTSIFVRDDYGILDGYAGNCLFLADAAEETARFTIRWAVDASRISYHKLGIGRDFRDHLVRQGLGDAVGSVGSGRPQDRKAFVNLRTEAAWNLKRRLDPERHLDDRHLTSSRQHPFSIQPRSWWALMREDLVALT